MKVETLEKLKKEAAEALSRNLCVIGSDYAHAAASLVEVLKSLEAMTAHVRDSAAVGGEIDTYTMPKRRSDPPSRLGQSPYCAGRDCEGEPEGQSQFCLDHQWKEKEVGAVGVVAPPRAPWPCPVVGCTYAHGHNAPCNGQLIPPEETKPPACAHLKECVLDADHPEGCYVPFKPLTCPHDNVGCGTKRICEVCKGETKRRAPDGGGFVQGLTFDPPVSMKQAEAAMDAIKTNVPSGKAMFLDGPAPTLAQVAHIRNEALEDAAKDVEALKLVGANECARILRGLRRKPPLGPSPFCAVSSCDNPPVRPGKYCCVHLDMQHTERVAHEERARARKEAEDRAKWMDYETLKAVGG